MLEGGANHGCILLQVPDKEGNLRRNCGHVEERPSRDARHMRHLRDQAIPHRQELGSRVPGASWLRELTAGNLEVAERSLRVVVTFGEMGCSAVAHFSLPCVGPVWCFPYRLPAMRWTLNAEDNGLLARVGHSTQLASACPIWFSTILPEEVARPTLPRPLPHPPRDPDRVPPLWRRRRPRQQLPQILSRNKRRLMNGVAVLFRSRRRPHCSQSRRSLNSTMF